MYLFRGGAPFAQPAEIILYQLVYNTLKKLEKNLDFLFLVCYSPEYGPFYSYG